jgi:hypothetical protein
VTPPVNRRRRVSGEEAMAVHKYTPGQSVRFSPHRYEDNSARGIYTIVRQLPEEGSTPQYRIKAKTDGRERVVREDQLTRS